MDAEPSDVEPEEKIPVWCPGTDWCAVTATASLVGRKWHPVIIQRLLHADEMGFNELEDAVDGVSSKVLSESLDDLEEKQLVERTVVSDKPVRVQYGLTPLGESLAPVVTALAEWGDSHLRPAESREESLV